MNLPQRLLATQPHDRISPTDGGGVPLRRALGIYGLVGVGLGTMLGGIFSTIGAGANVAGAGGVLASFGLTGIACVFVALCYAELASMVPIAGSAYTYAYATLGEFVAWIIGWDLILEYGISVAPLAATWSGSVQSFLSGYDVNLPPALRVAHVVFTSGGIDFAHSQIDVLAIAVVLAIAALLAIGIRESTRTNTLFVVIQIVALVVFVVALFGAVHPVRFVPAFPAGGGGVIAGAALVFFAYIGFDTVTVASEEAHDPIRDVPRAVIGSLIIGIVIFMAAAYVTVGIVPWQTIDPNAAMSDAVKTRQRAVAQRGRVHRRLRRHDDRHDHLAVGAVPHLLRDGARPHAAADRRARRRAHQHAGDHHADDRRAGGDPCRRAADRRSAGAGQRRDALRVCNRMRRRVRAAAAQARRGGPFRAPLGFVTAGLGALLCVLVMTGLGTLTWIRFVVWFAIGVVIYAAYGFRHSRLRDPA